MSLLLSLLADSVSPRASSHFTNENETIGEASSSSSVEGVEDSRAPFSREALEGLLAPPPSNNESSGGGDGGSVGIERETADESSYAGQTILSSAPSDTILNIERLGQTDNNPWPRDSNNNYYVSGNIGGADAAHPLSVSTTASCYVELQDSQEQQQNNAINSVTNIPRQDSFASLSFHASGMDSSIAMSDTNEEIEQQQRQRQRQQQQQEEERHNRIINTASFPSLEGYHSALPLQSTAIVMPHRGKRNTPINSRRLQDWFAKFNEKDLDNLRRRAQIAGKTLNISTTQPLPSSRPQGGMILLRPLQQLPPAPPVFIPEEQEDEGDDGALTNTDPTLSLQDIGVPTSLPDSFICPICRSAIVGALTLDCDCGTTVCSACWEYRAAASEHTNTAASTQQGGGEKVTEDTFALARGLDYEIVGRVDAGFGLGQQKQRIKCPCCHCPVQNPVYCHALDVAILRIVQGLSTGFQKFQSLYYERLREWREEVIRRQQEEELMGDKIGCCLSDEAIAQLIHQEEEEEEELWQQQQAAKARSTKKPILIPAAGAIGFVVAIVASVGIRLLTQRRIDSRSIRHIANARGN